MSVKGSGSANTVFQQQADAYLSQANPVSGTLYTVLDTTRNVRIYNIQANVAWAITQPTPLEVVLTIDGNTIIHGKADPVSGSFYFPTKTLAGYDEASQTLAADAPSSAAFVYEGRSVRVQVRITWAVTQPTPLVCRVKYAKIP